MIEKRERMYKLKKLELFYRKTLIKIMLKLNRTLGKLGALPEKESTWGNLDTLHKKLGSSNVSIQLYEKDRENKEFIFEVLKVLSNSGITVTLIEFKSIFDDKDYNTIKEINSSTKIDLRYVYPNYWGGTNISTEMNIESYLEIMDKVKYLVKVTKANFTRKR